jgi:hypothetical protein
MRLEHTGFSRVIRDSHYSTRNSAAPNSARFFGISAKITAITPFSSTMSNIELLDPVGIGS